MSSKEFGENLQELMKRERVTGRALAKDLAIPYKTVQEWIGSGGRMPRNADTIRKLAEHFDVSVHQLLYGESDPRGIINEILQKTEIHTGLYEITIRKVIKNKGDL